MKRYAGELKCFRCLCFQMVRRPLQGLLGEVFNKGDIQNFEDVRKHQHFVPHIDQPPGVKVETSMMVTMHSAMLATIGLVQVSPLALHPPAFSVIVNCPVAEALIN
jgi:hypothetical protein